MGWKSIATHLKQRVKLCVLENRGEESSVLLVRLLGDRVFDDGNQPTL